MAVNGQSPTQIWQPEQSSSSMTAVMGSSSTLPRSARARASAAAAPAWATVSGMSFGPWQRPGQEDAVR